MPPGHTTTYVPLKLKSIWIAILKSANLHNTKGEGKNTGVYANLVAKKDDTDFPGIIKRPGSIPYLAMVSHGLSHTQFWPEVESGLKGAFSSGVNPGYKKK